MKNSKIKFKFWAFEVIPQYCITHLYCARFSLYFYCIILVFKLFTARSSGLHSQNVLQGSRYRLPPLLGPWKEYAKSILSDANYDLENDDSRNTLNQRRLELWFSDNNCFRTFQTQGKSNIQKTTGAVRLPGIVRYLCNNPDDAYKRSI